MFSLGMRGRLFIVLVRGNVVVMFMVCAAAKVMVSKGGQIFTPLTNNLMSRLGIDGRLLVFADIFHGVILFPAAIKMADFGAHPT